MVFGALAFGGKVLESLEKSKAAEEKERKAAEEKERNAAAPTMNSFLSGGGLSERELRGYDMHEMEYRPRPKDPEGALLHDIEEYEVKHGERRGRSIWKRTASREDLQLLKKMGLEKEWAEEEEREKRNRKEGKKMEKLESDLIKLGVPQTDIGKAYSMQNALEALEALKDESKAKKNTEKKVEKKVQTTTKKAITKSAPKPKAKSEANGVAKAKAKAKATTKAKAKAK
jgi:hypothetical protein